MREESGVARLLEPRGRGERCGNTGKLRVFKSERVSDPARERR